MEKVTIEISTTNAAFGEEHYDKAAEAARILRELADRLEGGNAPYALKDVNGNVVGYMKIE